MNDADSPSVPIWLEILTDLSSKMSDLRPLEDYDDNLVSDYLTQQVVDVIDTLIVLAKDGHIDELDRNDIERTRRSALVYLSELRRRRPGLIDALPAGDRPQPISIDDELDRRAEERSKRIRNPLLT